MRKSAMQNIHDMNQRAIISYANHDLQRLKNQFGTGQGTTNKKPQQPTNTGNKKSSSLWDELNEGKSKQESGNFESSNVVYIKNPPIVNQQPVQPQNLQLEQMLKQIQDLEQALIQARQVNEEKTNKIAEQAESIQTKNNKILEVSNKNMELQDKLIEKTEQVNIEHNKYIDVKHKLDTHKLKLTNFIDNHQDVDDQEQLVQMLGDLDISDNH